MISEWKLLMLKYCAMAGEEKRMRLRLRMRIGNKNNLNDLKQLFIQLSSLDSTFHILQSAFC